MHLSPSMISRGGIYFNAIKNSRRVMLLCQSGHMDSSRGTSLKLS